MMKFFNTPLIRSSPKDTFSPMASDHKILTVAATQMRCTSLDENTKKAEFLVRIAAGRGAQIILLQELFQHPYFTAEISDENFKGAQTSESSTLLETMSTLAKDLAVVLPVSFFEKRGHSYYSTVAVIDADGTILGVYRKSHLSGRKGCQEKYYFSPGNTDYKVWKTRYGCIGVGISWDIWFPEVARAMVIQGADILFFPCAMGLDPEDSTRDTKDHWQRVGQGQAAANMTPIVVSNRVGVEGTDKVNVNFFGSSFIAGATGEMLKVADVESEGVLVETFDIDKLQEARTAWGVLRDRRVETYKILATRDGDI